jgi:hypothetical protein
VDAKTEREQLEQWIANSLAFRRKLRVVAIPAAVIAIAIWVWSSTPGIVAMIIVASIWGIGWWITFGHISDWRNRIDLLERRARSR